MLFTEEEVKKIMQRRWDVLVRGGMTIRECQTAYLWCGVEAGIAAVEMWPDGDCEGAIALATSLEMWQTHIVAADDRSAGQYGAKYDGRLESDWIPYYKDGSWYGREAYREGVLAGVEAAKARLRESAVDENAVPAT